MDTLVNVVAILSLPGLILTGVLGGGLGVAMASAILAAAIDAVRGEGATSRVQPSAPPLEADAAHPRTTS